MAHRRAGCSEYRCRVGRSKVTGTVRGTARGRARDISTGAAVSDLHVLVMAKEPVPGQGVETFGLDPRPAPRSRRPSWRKPHWPTRSRRSPRAVPTAACCRSMGGQGHDSRRFEVFGPQRGHGLDERLAAAWDHAGGPGLQMRMDTPQVTAALLDQCLGRLAAQGATADSASRKMAAGGRWACGGRTPPCSLGCRWSTRRTGSAQEGRLCQLGHQTGSPCLGYATSTTSITARAVAEVAPGGTRLRPRRTGELWQQSDTRVLVTGGAGFIGSAVVDLLVSRGTPGPGARQSLAECPRRHAHVPQLRGGIRLG